METRENSQKKMLLSVLGVAILVVAVIGISFAAYSATKESQENTINTGTIMVSYQEDTNAINITDALPIDDTTGIGMSEDAEMFTFTVSTKATNALTVPYTITLTPEAGNTLQDTEVKVYLTKNGTAVASYPKLVEDCDDITEGVRAGSVLLHTDEDVFTEDNVDANSIDTEYVLKMWVDQDYVLDNDNRETYSAKVNVDSAVAPIGG